MIDNSGGNASYTIFNSDENASNKPELVIGQGDEEPPPPPPPPGGGDTVTRNAIADAYVRSGNDDDNNFGNVDQLIVKNAGGNYGRESYLRFDLTGIGTSIMPVRFGVTPEIVLLTVKAK